MSLVHNGEAPARAANRIAYLGDQSEAARLRGDRGGAESHQADLEKRLRLWEQNAVRRHAQQREEYSVALRRAGFTPDESWMAQSPLLPAASLPVNLDGEVGWAEHPAPTRAMLAGWLYWYPLSELPTDGTRVIERVEDALSARALAWERDSRDENLKTTSRQAAREKVPKERAVLKACLAAGLRQREGHRLSGGEETVLVALASRLLSQLDASPRLATVTGGFSVCECCTLVWRAPRAQCCPACRRRNTTIAPDASERLVMAADPAAPGELRYQLSPRDRTLTVLAIGSGPDHNLYAQTCETCSTDFLAAHASTIYCPSCVTPAAYTKRSRTSKAGRAP